MIINNLDTDTDVADVFLCFENSTIGHAISLAISSIRGIRVTGMSDDKREIAELCSIRGRRDVLIGEGSLFTLAFLETLAAARKGAWPKLAIFTESVSYQLIQQSFIAGCNGYLLNSIDREELQFAVKLISKGKQYICSDAQTAVLGVIRPPLGGHDFSLTEPLSAREQEVLSMIANGHTNQEISDAIFLSKRTVEGHRESILRKTGAKNTAMLIKVAMVLGLLD